VDQINIISRWIHRHSEDRAFFPFQSALSDEQETQALVQRLWNEIDSVRLLPGTTNGEDETDEDSFVVE
jgi:DNA polymerase-3 subunit epsilon